MSGEGEKKLDRVMRLPEIAVSLGVCERSVRRMTDRGELARLVKVRRAAGLMAGVHAMETLSTENVGELHFLRNSSISGWLGRGASNSWPSSFFKYLVKKETR